MSASPAQHLVSFPTDVFICYSWWNVQNKFPSLEGETQHGGEKPAFLSSLSNSLFQWAVHHDWWYICHHSSCMLIARCPPKWTHRRRTSLKWFLDTGTCSMKTSNSRKIRTLSLAVGFSVHLLSFLCSPFCIWATLYVRQNGWSEHKNDVNLRSVPKELSVKWGREHT